MIAMPRARNIKHEFFWDETLGQCCADAQLLFIGLWTLADRAGRLEDKPTVIKGRLFPFRDCDVAEHLSMLAKYGFVVRYEVDGRKYMQIKNFLKHQSPHPKEQESSIPGPQCTSNCLVIGEQLSSPLQASGEQVASNLLVSGEQLFSNCLTSDSGNQKEIQSEGKAISNQKEKQSETREAFEEFWEAYPKRNGKRVGRATTLRLWKAFTTEEQQDLLIATANYANSKAAAENFAKDPERFLKDAFWKDWLTPAEPPKRQSRMPSPESLATWTASYVAPECRGGGS